MRYALLSVLLLALAGCGGGALPPPDKANATKSNPTNAPVAPKNSLAAQYENSYQKAEKAVQAMVKDLNAESYAQAGALCYTTLRIGIEHEKNGQDLGLLRHRREMNVLFTEWKKEGGKLTIEDKKRYEEIPEFAEAKKAYVAAGGS
ncbi:MAG: hypothetical protein IPK87_07120 [Planctomycetes bacterium]|nr:hypothetical protein [Planctomycetota bacterium]